MAKLAAITLFLCILTAANASAQESGLNITPKRCIALKKGQVCYQSLRIQYETTEKSDFCLVVSKQSQPLKCWRDTNFAEYRYRFASNQNLDFSVTDLDGETLSKESVTVAWVYKKSRKRYRWRLF